MIKKSFTGWMQAMLAITKTYTKITKIKVAKWGTPE
jgi:hypothetical protein